MQDKNKMNRTRQKRNGQNTVLSHAGVRKKKLKKKATV
jgi:hypothetical protein